MNKQELISAIYTKAYRKTPHSFGSVDYYSIKPTPITMDDGRVVNVEWVQCSYWGMDVLINYRTDCLKTTRLSENELKQIYEVI